jgi:RNA-directed DNA polymerase
MAGDSRYFYRRYMDDIIVLAKTPWHLRKAVRTANQHFNQLKVAQAQDKTFIGKISRGWDFLGDHFDGKQLTLAAKTVEKHVLRYRQLYERLSKKKATSDEMALALGQYAKPWPRWVKAGIGAWVTTSEPITYQRACSNTGLGLNY